MSNHPEMLIDELQSQISDLQSQTEMALALLRLLRANADYYAIPPYIVNCINHTIERIEE